MRGCSHPPIVDTYIERVFRKLTPQGQLHRKYRYGRFLQQRYLWHRRHFHFRHLYSNRNLYLNNHTCSKQQQHDVHYFHFQLNPGAAQPSTPRSRSAERRKFLLPYSAEWRLERLRTGTAKFRRLFSFPLQRNLFLDGPGRQFAFDERTRL